MQACTVIHSERHLPGSARSELSSQAKGLHAASRLDSCRDRFPGFEMKRRKA